MYVHALDTGCFYGRLNSLFRKRLGHASPQRSSRLRHHSVVLPGPKERCVAGVVSPSGQNDAVPHAATTEWSEHAVSREDTYNAHSNQNDEADGCLEPGEPSTASGLGDVFDATSDAEWDETASTITDDENPYTTEDALSVPAEGLAGGEPALEALLAENGADCSLERICQVFPFQLDNFQKKAVEKFLEGKSVVVCAPTGAGKTAIAEAAAAATLARGQRVIYTTPLKALSNQKLFETRKRFGASRVGLQTGDTSLNTEAAIVIMTTEILRNIMYRTAELSDDSVGAQATREVRLGDVGLIVLDEVHYLGDPSRGSVWEEVIINCPRHIQLLCMSATVKNPDDLGGWIAKEHQECVTIKTRFRPVPLQWHFSYRNVRGVVLTNLLDASGKGLNPKLEQKQVMLEEARLLLQRGQQGPLPKQRSKELPWERSLQALMDEDAGLQRRVAQKRIPGMDSVILRLRKLNYLPAIWFILSRKDCDANAMRAAGVSLNSPEEQLQVQAELDALRADQPEAIREPLVPSLIRGFASHHAGHLPGWKSLVERLFQRGLLKIVFATGTLAAGINMPARTTLISALARKTDEGPQLLPHNELLQMAGRAGRRGFDVQGHCIILQNRFEGADEAWQIIQKGPEPLVSQFSVSYGLVLNLLSVYTMDQAKEFISRSFGNFLQTEGNARRLREAEEMEAKAKALMAEFKATATTTIKELNSTVKRERETLRRLKERAIEQRVWNARSLIKAVGLPRKVILNLTRNENDKPLLIPAVLVGEVDPMDLAPPVDGVGSNSGASTDPIHLPYYACLGADNRVLRVSVMHLAGVLEGPQGGIEQEDVDKIQSLLSTVRPKGWANATTGLNTCLATPGNAATAVVALKLQAKYDWKLVEIDVNLANQVVQQREAVQDALRALEVQRKASANRGSEQTSSMEKMVRARRLLKKAETLRLEMTAQLDNTWRVFTEVLEILITMGAMEKDSLRVLPLGLVARNLQGQNELWLALALTHPDVMDLNGPQLAAFLGALLSAEVIKRPIAFWTAYSTSDQVVRVIESLEPTRQLLSELQSDAGLSRWNDHLLVDLRLAGLVEAWAAGAGWTQIMQDSAMDDGDVARLLIRTTDLLRQIVYNSQLLPYLKPAALEALRGMDRAPVAEVII